MKLSQVAAMGSAAAMIALLVACSSDSTSSGGSASDAGGGGGNDGSTTGSDSGGGGGNDSGGGGNDSGGGGNDSGGGGNDSGGGGDSGASAACQAYCTCMATNCANTTVTGGATCLAACAAGSTWDLTCRTQHCGFAVGAAMNGVHCQHANGELSVCQ